MSTSTTSTSSGGVGFFGLLAIALIILKLTGVIAWSWLWVLAPLWVGAVFGLFAFLIALIIAAASDAGRDGWRR